MWYIYCIKSKEMEPNAKIRVRLFSYKSFRHYGGREITTNAHFCDALFLEDQGSSKVVSITDDCAGYKAGHKISVMNKDFNL